MIDERWGSMDRKTEQHNHSSRTGRAGENRHGYVRYMKKEKYKAALIVLLVFVIILAIWLVIWKNSGSVAVFDSHLSEEQIQALKPDIDVELLTPNPYSRPQTPTDGIKGIVVHYTANPGSTAIQNRNYFEGLKDSHETYASSNFIVGIDGEIVQCIPTNEVAYASNNRNHDTVSIETCHPDATGKFTDATYDSLVHLVGWLCIYLEVSPDQVIRHYDVTGKSCPLYFVEHKDAWEDFKGDVRSWVEKNT